MKKSKKLTDIKSSLEQLSKNFKDFTTGRYSGYGLKYLANIDYNSNRNCNDNQCDGICRCSTISNARITSVSGDSLYTRLCNEITNEFILYTLDRVIQKSPILDPSSWSVRIVGGYYGEEAEAEPPDMSKFFLQIEKIIAANSNFELIKIALEAEYAYLLQSLIDNEYEASIIEVPSEKISLGNEDYMIKIGKNAIPFMEEYTLPRAVCFDQGSKYRLIDGYHRTTAALQNKMKTIKIVSLTKI